MKLQEALDLLQDPEKLRIRAAELDGWTWRPMFGNPEDFSQEQKALATMCWVPPGADPWQRTEIPSYPTDANALHEAEKRLGLHDRSDKSLRVKWVNCLHDLMGKQPGCPVNKSGSPVVSDIDCLLALTPVRCAAYVMAAEWKKVNQPEKL